MWETSLVLFLEDQGRRMCGMVKAMRAAELGGNSGSMDSKTGLKGEVFLCNRETGDFQPSCDRRERHELVV